MEQVLWSREWWEGCLMQRLPGTPRGRQRAVEEGSQASGRQPQQLVLLLPQRQASGEHVCLV